MTGAECIADAEETELQGMVVEFNEVAPAFPEAAELMLDPRNIDGCQSICTIGGREQTCFQVVLDRPLKNMRLVEVDDDTVGLASLDMLVSLHACRGDESGATANVDPRQLRSSSAATTTLHTLVLPRSCSLQQFKSALFEWEVDPGHLVSSEVIACLPLDIDRERCKALLLRMVELGGHLERHRLPRCPRQRPALV